MRKGMRQGDEGGDEEYGGVMRREGVRGTVEVWESGVAVGRRPDSKLGGVGDE